MTPEEFISFCKAVKHADKTGRKGQEKSYFRVVYAGYTSRRLTKMPSDDELKEAYELGRELSKRLK